MHKKAQPKRFWEEIKNGFDFLLGIFSPRIEFQRRMFRIANNMAVKGAYDGASHDRLRASWKSSRGSADEDLLFDLNDLRERSRDLVRNDGIAAGIISTMVNNIVGHGIMPQSRVDKEIIGLSDEEADSFQKVIEREWDKWSPHADTAGRMNFWEIQQMVQSQVLINGEVIIVREMVDDPWRPYSLALNVIEADRLDTPWDLSQNKNIRRGVELGSRGEPIAYWIRKTHPGDYFYGNRVFFSQDFVRFPIRNEFGQLNVLHLYWKKRPGQTRGEPFFSPVLLKFKELADYMEAELVGARIAACFSIFITKMDAYTTAMRSASGTKNDKRLEAIEPGIIEYLNPGEQVNVANPNRPGSQFDPFVDKILKFIGAGLGLPYELVIKDFSKSNYSSARAAILEARKLFRCSQSWMSEKLCQPVWELFAEECFLRGTIDAPNFYQYQKEYCRARWIAPGWGYIDPEKEINASTEAIKNNLSTLADECAAIGGKDWEDVLDQRAREEKRKKDLGLPEEQGNTITLTAGQKGKNNQNPGDNAQ